MSTIIKLNCTASVEKEIMNRHYDLVSKVGDNPEEQHRCAKPLFMFKPSKYTKTASNSKFSFHDGLNMVRVGTIYGDSYDDIKDVLNKINNN